MYGVNGINEYLRERFGKKVVKLSLDAGFTCPNRDGKCGTGGCIFCSEEGSGDNAGRGSIGEGIKSQLALMSGKWPDASHIVYFQSHTNTYAPAESLKRIYAEALSYSEQADIVGLAIATRPDCLPEETLELLSELNEKTFLWVELGLQTIHEESAAFNNRGYGLKVFDEAFESLRKRNIKTVVHLLFGLPKAVERGKLLRESREEMLASLDYVCGKMPFGLKLHMLNVVKNSPLALNYPDYVPFESPEEYVNLVCDAIERIPHEITIHRLYGDVPQRILLAPEWAYKKRTVLNGIEKELARRGSFQGCLLQAEAHSQSGPKRLSL